MINLFDVSIKGWEVLLLLLVTIFVLSLLWKYYEDRYSFSFKEKVNTTFLALTFSVVGSLLFNGVVPIVAWTFYAFHFSVDKKYMELPNAVNGLIALSAIYPAITQIKDVGFLQSGVMTSLILFVVFLTLALVGSMGGGDIKLMTVSGLFFTVPEIPRLIFFGFLIGAIYGIALMILKKKDKNSLFAFGPSLILGVLMTVCLG